MSSKPTPFIRYDNLFTHAKRETGDGGGDDMLQRIKALEKDVHDIKTDVAIIKSNYASKADLSEAKFSIIVWVVGAIFLAQLMPPIISAIKATIL